MKIYGLWTLIIGLTFSSCNQNSQTTNSVENQKENITFSKNDKDIEEIQTLIRQVLNWADSKNSIDLLPVLSDSKDSIYIGFDLEKHNQNLQKLSSTNFFATEFIVNYNQIVLTLDKGLRNAEYEEWLFGDMPSFAFANGANPWCLCQDNLDWNTVDVKIIYLDNEKAELEWYWGQLNADTHSSWKKFAYNFRVKKVDNKWKIAYLTGFDFKESTRKTENYD